jgi:hypothetical protein
MIWFTPYCVIISVVTTALTALFVDKSVPYYPIEISRTATGPTSRWVFSLGLTLSVLTLVLEHPTPKKYTLAIIGVLLLAWVDDEVSRFWHMVGVGLLFVGSVVAISNWKVAWVPLLCGAGIYAARLIIKGLAVIFLEKTTNGLLDWRGVATESIRIMYTGQVKEPMTLRLFEITGVMQWILLWLLYQIIIRN